MVFAWPVFAKEVTEVQTQSSVYVVATSSPLTPRQDYLPTGNGECVALIQSQGFKLRGNAYEWVKFINSNTPAIGSAVLLDEGTYQHLALIVGLEDGINLVEQNYKGKYIISKRTIPANYSRIVGFIHL